jgi:hypothetical protein
MPQRDYVETKKICELITAAAMVVIACGLASAAQRSAYLIPHSDLTVSPPTGWVFNHHIASTTPSLYFELPHPEHGSYAAYPALEIELLVGDRAPKSFSDYFNRQFGRFVLPPRNLTIDGYPAVEFAYYASTIYDFADGTGRTTFHIAHEVLLKRAGVFVRCLLDADPDNYTPYSAVPTFLCSSVVSRRNSELRSNNSVRDFPSTPGA